MLHKKFMGTLAACATLLSALAFTSPAMASDSTVNPLNKAAITLVKRKITFYQNKIVGDNSDLAAKRSRAAATGVIDRNGNLTDVCANARGEFDTSPSACEYKQSETYRYYDEAKYTLWKDQHALASAQQQLSELNADFTPEVFANYSGDNPANSLSAKFLIKEINNLKNTIAADKADLAGKRIDAAKFGAIDENGNLADLCKNARGEFDSSISTCRFDPADTYRYYDKARKTLQYHENALASALQQLKELNNSATSHSTTSDNTKVQNLETEIAKDKAEVTQYRELAAAAGVIDKNGNLTDLCTNARGEFDSSTSTCEFKPAYAYRNYLNALEKLAKNKNALAALRHQLGEDEDDSNESQNENEDESNDESDDESNNESDDESESDNESESDDESDDYFDIDDIDWGDLDDLLDEIDFDDFDWSSNDYEDTNYYNNDYSYSPYYY